LIYKFIIIIIINSLSNEIVLYILDKIENTLDVLNFLYTDKFYYS